MGPVGYLATSTMPRKRDGAPQTPFAARFQDWLRERGLRQGDVALALGVSLAQVSAVARGMQKPSRDFIAGLVREYELPAQEWWEAAGYEIATGKPVDERQKVAEIAVQMALSGEPRWLERVLLETLAEYYQEPPFLAMHNSDLGALPPDAVKHVVIRRVQLVETRLRERREAAGASLPPPLFVTGE